MYSISRFGLVALIALIPFPALADEPVAEVAAQVAADPAATAQTLNEAAPEEAAPTAEPATDGAADAPAAGPVAAAAPPHTVMLVSITSDADGTKTIKKIWLDLDAYVANHGTLVQGEPVRRANGGCDERTDEPNDATPAPVPEFPPIPLSPSNDLTPWNVSHQRIVQAAGDGYIQVIEWQRKTHYDPATDTWSAPGAWSKPVWNQYAPGQQPQIDCDFGR